jgi:hypothetical protein
MKKQIKEEAEEYFNKKIINNISVITDKSFVSIKKETIKSMFIKTFEDAVKYSQSWTSFDDELPEIGSYIILSLSESNNWIALVQIADKKHIEHLINYWKFWRLANLK